MGDVIITTRFPKPKTDPQRETLRRRFARRPVSRRARRDMELPPLTGWRRR